jgi:DNA-binding transcriptional LysR family regulator
MTFTQLMAFAAVAKNRSITKAAQTLRVSQPSVSKHLKILEDSYGVKLFERNTGMLELTEEGRTCLRRVNGILFHLDKLKTELSPRTFSKSAPLKIAGSYAASAVLLPSVIAIFQKNHRDTRIILRTGSTNIVKGMLLNSEVELALLNERPTNSNLAAEKFREENLLVFAAPGHPLSRKKELTLSHFNQVDLVATGGKGRLSTTEKILKLFVHQGVRAHVAIRCGTPEAVKAIVRKRIGVGILFADTVMPEIKEKIFKALKFPGLKLTGHSYIIYYKDRPLSSPAREFLVLLRQKSKKKRGTNFEK